MKKNTKNCFVYFSLSAKHILYCCLLISHIPLFQFFVVVVDVFSFAFFSLFFLKLLFVLYGINVPQWNFFGRLNKRAGTFIQYSRVSWKKGTSMRYARVSASQIQFCPGIGHQWRKIRLRKDRDAGGANPRGARGFRGRAPWSFWGLDVFALCGLNHKTDCLVHPL